MIKMIKSFISASTNSDVVASGQKPKTMVDTLSLFGNLLIKKIMKPSSKVDELVHSQERYLNLFNLSTTATITVNQNFNIILFNQSAERVYGFPSSEVFGKPITMLIPESDRAAYKQELSNFAMSEADFSSTGAEIKGDALRKDGEVFPVEVRLGKSQEEDDMLITISVTDITERVKSEQEIRYQAHYDSLTRLPNRLLSMERLKEYIKSTRDNFKIGVMFLDLDDFKKINDSMGHEAGDSLLVESAKRLKEVLNEDCSVGRLGGDEFIILVDKLESVEEVKHLAEKLVKKFRDPFEVEGRTLVLTSSIGVSLYPDDAETPSALLRNADLAMYYSKKLGRNTYSLFNDGMSESVSRRLLVEEQMRLGLKNREFSLHYQPKVDLRDNKVKGVEALARWNNEVLGDVSPEEFIAIAEHSGLIVELGQFVISEALQAMETWSKRGCEVSVAVNLSPIQFHDPSLISFIKNSIQKANVDPELIELEITEGVLMSGHQFITESLQSLSNLGIRLAMDDFGTGFSSLSYLRHYSFDTLKIDRSFITELMENEEDQKLVNAIIAMAHSLGLEVVAEGVETIEQLDYLKLQGCEYAQGFLHGKPMSFDALTEILLEDHSRCLEATVA